MHKIYKRRQENQAKSVQCSLFQTGELPHELHYLRVQTPETSFLENIDTQSLVREHLATAELAKNMV